MSKKMLIITIAICLAAFVAGFGFAALKAVNSEPEFAADGYVLRQDGLSVKQVAFDANEKYRVTKSGTASFTSNGEKVTIPSQSFAFLDDNSVLAMSDGIFLDFKDLSDNFINHYFITARLPITRSGNTYTAETSSGSITFGEHLWKLSDNKYLIESPNLIVAFSEDDKRGVNDYVIVDITEDGIVQIITKDNIWMTISDTCYIETAGGVRIYPVSTIIDNDNYKLSIAKLSVDPEDCIVLTEAETRRQIVPQLNIEAIDGKNGADGNEGQTGRTGTEGTTGQKGEQGDTGADGGKGKGGSDGDEGEGGKTGDNGSAGSGGQGGADGAAGSGGLGGARGQKGDPALGATTTNTALPLMTISDWRVTATSLRGTIFVEDEGDCLSSDFEGKEAYAATVTIINEKTGEKISCYQLESIDDPVTADSRTSFDKFYVGAEEISFATESSALVPDTYYKLSVKAYYKVNETIFSREFIGRYFYTSSAGVFLSEKKAEVSSLTINVDVAREYQDSVTNAEVYLLTPIQNVTFNRSPSDWMYRCVLDYLNGNVTFYDKDNVLISQRSFGSDMYHEDLVFNDLAANCSYVSRVIVTTADMSVLTDQELNSKTLKHTPTWTERTKVSYNRVTGGFEVFRPIVSDPDGGAVSYTYTAYDSAGNPLYSRTLSPSESEPAIFFMDSGNEYTFGVSMTFNDNAKDVLLDLGKTDPTRAEGTSMPKIILNVTKKEYNQMIGELKIDLSSSAEIKVDPNMPLELAVYADQIYDAKIVLVDENTVTESDGDNPMYTATYSAASSNQPKIDLDFENLYKNTNYTITITGYLDVGDGNGLVRRVIGVASFRTLDTVPLSFSMENLGGTKELKVKMRIVPQDPEAGEERNAYAVSQLLKGEILLDLLTGSGYSAELFYPNAFIEDAASLEKAYGEGFEIKKEIFNDVELTEGAVYTVRVSRVMDQTYEMNKLSYVNDFGFANSPSTVVEGPQAQLDLLTDPAQGILALPIYNKSENPDQNAASFGVSYDKSLPDDAIIGYALESRFDNTRRKGLTVTYYAFEYLAFYNTVTADEGETDPIKAVDPLMKSTLDISSASDTVPKVAYLFGGTKTDTPEYINGYYVYHTGPANSQGGALISGMDRGFRYIFAYTAEYSTGGSTEGAASQYPYDNDNYENYKNYYGVGSTYGGNPPLGPGKKIGAGKAYVLNSGMCEAPKVTPTFYTYVHSVENVNLPNAGSECTGDIVIHYTHRYDVDGTIDGFGGTDIYYPSSQVTGQTLSQSYGAAPLAEDPDWYSIAIPYKAARNGGEILSPTVGIDVYVLDYSELMSTLRSGTKYESIDDNVYLCSTPLDWAWDTSFEMYRLNGSTVGGEIDVSNLEDNYVQINLTETMVGLQPLLASRAFCMRVTVSAAGVEEKTFYLPLDTNDFTQISYSRLSTGLLGTEYLNKPTKVQADILYDSGIQGWAVGESLSESSGFMGLELITDTAGYAGHSGYYTISSNGETSTSPRPKNGLLKAGSVISLSAIRAVTGGTDGKNDDAVSYNFSHYYLTGKSSSFNRMLRPMHDGIDASYNKMNPSGRNVVPKGVGVYPLTFVDDTMTLTEMTPTMQYGGYHAAANSVEIDAFKVLAADSAGSNQVYVALFESEEEARKLEIGEDTPVLTLTLDANGNYDGKGADSFEHLTAETQYYAVFYMHIYGKDVILLDAETTDKAIYPVKTSTRVTISSELGLTYETNCFSYFQKEMQLTFSLSRTFGITLGYDFYLDAASAESAAGTPYLSQQEMLDNKILTAPEALGISYNSVKISMMPSTAREKLAPGSTYYLRVTAYETVDGTPQDVGYKVFPVVVPPIGNNDAVIRVTDISQNSVTYQVTMFDPQFSFMGNKDYGNGSGLYAVRFTYTDDNGNECRLDTRYDKYVYSENVSKREFILSNDVLVHPTIAGQEVVTNKTYTMHVYAVVDEKHTNQSPSITGAPDGVKSAEYFFGTLTSEVWDSQTYQIASVFRDFVNSFWEQGSYLNKPGMDTVEAKFRIASKEQRTADDVGVLLNKDRAVITRSGATQFRLLLPESFGIIGPAPDYEQTYKRIEWDIRGTTSTGEGLHYRGTSLASNYDMLFQEATGQTYKYYYTIAQDAPRGDYTITIQLFTTETGGTPETISRTFYD